MINIPSIACGLPLCQDPQQNQTNISLYLRTTTVVIGILAAFIGILILYGGLSWFHQFGSITGWVLFSIGSLAAIVALSIRCIKQQPQQHIPSQKNEELALVRINGSKLFTYTQSSQGEDLSLTRINEVIFTPTWHERKIKNGYRRCSSIEESKLNENLDSLLRMVGATDVKQINIFSLCYKMEGNEIFIDLASHEEVSNNHLATIEMDGETFYTKSFFNPFSFLGLQKTYKYSYTTIKPSHFFHNAMPRVLFFGSHNGIQVEIGYINLNEIFEGRDVSIQINNDNSITISDSAV